MDSSEYINAVVDQIRCRRARPLVSQEMENHIADQAEAYEKEGKCRDEAFREAVRQMGDPVEVGIAMDRIHRPAANKPLLFLVALLSLLGLVFQYFAICNGTIFDAGTQSWFFGRQCLFTFAGLGIMLAVYFCDYSIIGKYPLLLWFGYLTLLLLAITFFFPQINGKLRIYNYLNLFLPLYAGILYHFRDSGGKWGYGKIILCALFGLFPTLLALHTVLINGSLQIALSCYLLFCLAASKGWFKGNRKVMLLLMAVIPVAAYLFLYAISATDVRLPFLQPYQQERLAYVMGHHTERIGPVGYYNYATPVIRDTLPNLKLFGSTAPFSNTPEPAGTGLMRVDYINRGAVRGGMMHTDYVIFFLFTRFGIIPGTAVLLLLAAVLYKVFSVSWRQKNQLGFMVSMSCSMVLAIEVITYVLTNFGLIPLEPMTMPFLSYGGQNSIGNYILTGLILSVYRNKDIISENQIRKNRLRIKLIRADSQVDYIK